jgi:hypothetical protein
MLRDDRLRDVADVALATLEHGYLVGVNVKAAHGISVPSEQ